MMTWMAIFSRALGPASVKNNGNPDHKRKPFDWKQIYLFIVSNLVPLLSNMNSRNHGIQKTSFLIRSFRSCFHHWSSHLFRWMYETKKVYHICRYRGPQENIKLHKKKSWFYCYVSRLMDCVSSLLSNILVKESLYSFMISYMQLPKYHCWSFDGCFRGFRINANQIYDLDMFSNFCLNQF